jgi:hypothetical protein
MGTQGPTTQADDGKTRMLRFVSRCSTVDELVDTFANLIDESTLFICTKNVFDVGLRRRFSVTLRNGTPVFRGEAEVQESPARLSGPTSPIGIRLRLLKLTPDSLALRERLLEKKREKEVTQVEPLPLPPVPIPPVRTITPRKGRSGRFQTTPGAGPVMPPAERISGLMPALTPPPAEPPSEVIRADTLPNKVDSVQVKIESGPVKSELSDSAIPVRAPSIPSGRTIDALAKALEPPTRIDSGGRAPVVPPAAAAAALASAVSLKAASPPPIPAPPAVPDGDADAEADALTRPRAPSVAAAEGSAEERAPSSDIILPANPLSEISDRSLEAMIEVVIYEDDLPPRDEVFDNLLTPRPMPIPPALAVPPPPAESSRNGASSADRHDLGALAERARTATGAPDEFLQPARRGGGRFAFSLLAIVLGFAAGYLVFGTDLVRGRSEEAAESPPQPAAAEPTPAAASGEPAAAPASPTPAPAEPTPAPTAAAGATPAAATCTASIDTSPETARVLLDGDELGVGSLENVAVPCGREFTLTVEHAGYKTFERHFTAEAEVPLRIDAALTRQESAAARAKSRLRIVSDPPGAIVTVDGKVIGRGPAAVTVGTGDTVFVTATLKGYKGWSKKVYVKKKTQSVKAALEAIE